MKRIISLGLLVMLVWPGAVQAQGASQRVEAFCETHPERRSAIINGLTERTEAYEQAVNRQSDNQAERRNRLDEALIKKRAEADIRRGQSYQLIMEKQQSDEAKALASAYAAEVDAAVTARRIAYDQARADFRTAVDGLLVARDQDMRGAISAFRASAESTTRTAEEECARDGSEQAAIRQQLIRGLQSARLDYNQRLRDRQDFRVGVREAIKTRNETYKSATTEFQRAMQSIRDKYADLRS